MLLHFLVIGSLHATFQAIQGFRTSLHMFPQSNCKLSDQSKFPSGFFHSHIGITNAHSFHNGHCDLGIPSSHSFPTHSKGIVSFRGTLGLFVLVLLAQFYPLFHLLRILVGWYKFLVVANVHNSLYQRHFGCFVFLFFRTMSSNHFAERLLGRNRDFAHHSIRSLAYKLGFLVFLFNILVCHSRRSQRCRAAERGQRLGK
mmetsp:Transcript_31426/g.75785  ORF Transcript_31426/g.75785 Transcript_31426/m.75785 type:complete len:200 (+) Transcript_31426:1003-1602(+)